MVFTESGPLLQVSLMLYLAAAALSLLFYKKHRAANIIAHLVCMLAAVFSLVASLQLIFSGEKGLRINLCYTSMNYLSLDLNVDKLSAFFMLGMSVLVFAVSLYSISYLSHYYEKKPVGVFNFLYALFILSMYLVFTAGNSIFFYLAWEAMAVLSYFLVVFEAEEAENRRAGMIYLIMTHLGTAFLLLAIMLTYGYSKSFDLFGVAPDIPVTARNMIFVLYLIGFGTKAGIIPLHIWLPYAHPAAPSNISALMSGIMIKTAVYGMIRFIYLNLGVESIWWGVALLGAGIVSAVFGVAYAYVENNIKKVLAYSSIENMGIIMIGLGVAFMAEAEGNDYVSAVAMIAVLFHAFNHTLIKGGLFMGAGAVHFAAHSKNMDELGGLIKKMPVTSVFFLIGALAISAMVPFNGFAGEWLIYQSIFIDIKPGQPALNTALIFGVIALALAGGLAAAAFIKLFGISFLGLARSEKALQAEEVPLAMHLGSGILAILSVGLGIFPIAFLKLADRVVWEITAQSVYGKLQGGVLMAFFPVNVSENAISPRMVLSILLIIFLSVWIVLKLLGGKKQERYYGTWDCGYHGLNARMQYSGEGFSNPIKIVFKTLFQPSRHLKMEAGTPYCPGDMEYLGKEESIFEKYFYRPLMKKTIYYSKMIKFSVQTGSIHMYLIYIFVAVLALMLYNRLV